jgi:hypothetical protein
MHGRKQSAVSRSITSVLAFVLQCNQPNKTTPSLAENHRVTQLVQHISKSWADSAEASAAAVEMRRLSQAGSSHHKP